MRITIHTSQTTARKDWHAECGALTGRAFLYVDGTLCVQTRARTDAEAVRQAVRQFRLTRADRKSA